jgi:hypothetical protein
MVAPIILDQIAPQNDSPVVGTIKPGIIIHTGVINNAEKSQIDSFV